MLYVSNAISCQMIDYLPANGIYRLEIYKVDKEHAKTMLENSKEDYISSFGHEDIAQTASSELGYKLSFNRVDIKLNIGDKLLVCQFTGGRLPEGCTKLPENIKIEYFSAYVTY